jgi:hypothetical protein
MSDKQEWPDVLLWACPICGETKLADLTIERHTAFICGGQWIRVNGEWVSERAGCERAMPVVAALRAQLQAAEALCETTRELESVVVDLTCTISDLHVQLADWVSLGKRMSAIIKEPDNVNMVDLTYLWKGIDDMVELCDKAAE